MSISVLPMRVRFRYYSRNKDVLQHATLDEMIKMVCQFEEDKYTWKISAQYHIFSV